MPRSLWTGSISFGLVAVPVRLVTAVRDKSIHFNLLSPDGSCRLRRKLFCPETGQEFDFNQTARGYEVAPDRYVLIQEDELDRLKPEAGRTIDISDFVELASVDPMYFERTYYLLPGEGGARAYQLLLEAMRESGRAAVAQFVMHEKQHLCLLRPAKRTIVLHTMHYDDEVVPPDEFKDELGSKDKPDTRELKVAQQLIGALDTTFEPAQYKDDYRDKVQELVEKKAAGESVANSTQTEDELDHTAPINLMEALKKSLAQRGSGSVGAAGKNAGKSTAARGKGKASSTTTRRRKSA